MLSIFEFSKQKLNFKDLASDDVDSAIFNNALHAKFIKLQIFYDETNLLDELNSIEYSSQNPSGINNILDKYSASWFNTSIFSGEAQQKIAIFLLKKTAQSQPNPNKIWLTIANGEEPTQEELDADDDSEKEKLIGINTNHPKFIETDDLI